MGEVIPCDNVAADRRCQFRFEPAVLKRLDRYKGIAGVYHSHVDTAAFLSSADKDGFGLVGCLYFIASVRNGVCVDVKCWTLMKLPRQFIEVKL